MEETTCWSGERVLWRGQANRTLVFERSDLPRLALALVAIALAALLHRIISQVYDSVFSSIYLALCVLVFAGNGIVPILVRAWRLRDTEYVVTDRRALAISDATGKRNERSVAHTHRSAPTVVRARPDGTGTVVFGSLPSLLDAAFAPEWQRRPLILHDVEHAAEVCELVRRHAAVSR
ncbi:hypothetical protein [Crossiella sp. NPDC003009]